MVMSPALGRTIFHHDPDGNGAHDYLALSGEVLERLNVKLVSAVVSESSVSRPSLVVVTNEVQHG